MLPLSRHPSAQVGAVGDTSSPGRVITERLMTILREPAGDIDLQLYITWPSDESKE